MAFRVPTLDVSVVDLTVTLKNGTSYADLCKKMKEAAEGELKVKNINNHKRVIWATLKMLLLRLISFMTPTRLSLMPRPESDYMINSTKLFLGMIMNGDTLTEFWTWPIT